MTTDYEIGYGKPPENTRFKAGQSGNGKGRPKGRKKEDIIDLLNKELKSKLTLKDGNKITKETAMLRQLCNKASTGDYKSGKLILEMASRQQMGTLAVEFLEKLIREKYITERNAKEYLRSDKVLDMETPKSVCYMCLGARNDRSKAWMAVLNVLCAMSVWQQFNAVLMTRNILSTIEEEYFFWEGFDRALDCMQVDEEKRKELIIQAEESRYYKRPDDSLFKIAIETNMFMVSCTLQSFINVRNAFKDTRGYEEAEEKWFSEEHLEHIFSEEEPEVKEREYENLKKLMKTQERELSDFYRFSFKTKEFSALRAKLKKEDIETLLEWYNNISIKEC